MTNKQSINKVNNFRHKLNGSDVFRVMEQPEFSNVKDSNYLFFKFNITVPCDKKRIYRENYWIWNSNIIRCFKWKNSHAC